MVEVEEIVENEETPVEVPPSEERILDAIAIEEAAVKMTRPSARLHLEALAKKLRKDGAALKRVEASRSKLEEASVGNETAEALPKAPAPVPRQPATAPPVLATAKYVPIDRFSFDSGGYNSTHVTIYISLPGVGSIPKDQVSCNFTPSSFDLIVRDLEGKSYRLFKDNLEKDIDPKLSKIVIKADKVLVKLGKIKSEYGSLDHWSQLTATKKKKVGPGGKSKEEDPQASIMTLMKEMYEDGDDNMRKIIGETMMKQRTGQLDKEPGLGLDKDFD